MKKSELKKLLKTCTYTVNIFAPTHEVYTAKLIINNPHNTYLRTVLLVNAQANDSKGPNARESDKNVKAFLKMPGIGSFYGVRVNAEVNYDLMGTEYLDPSRAQAFFDLVRECIDKHNIQYVYPECVLSQILKALEYMGCTREEVNVCGVPYSDWYKVHKE